MGNYLSGGAQLSALHGRRGRLPKPNAALCPNKNIFQNCLLRAMCVVLLSTFST